MLSCFWNSFAYSLLRRRGHLGWINLCEPAFYIHIYIFYRNRFFSNLLYILLIVGLTCHRFRPFTVASCSRDSTVRIWSLSHLACSFQIDVLAKKSLEEIVTPNTGMVSTQISETLCVWRKVISWQKKLLRKSQVLLNWRRFASYKNDSTVLKTDYRYKSLRSQSLIEEHHIPRSL